MQEASRLRLNSVPEEPDGVSAATSKGWRLVGGGMVVRTVTHHIRRVHHVYWARLSHAAPGLYGSKAMSTTAGGADGGACRAVLLKAGSVNPSHQTESGGWLRGGRRSVRRRKGVWVWVRQAGYETLSPPSPPPSLSVSILACGSSRGCCIMAAWTGHPSPSGPGVVVVLGVGEGRWA
ncbi:hypothetical protein E2C01_004640 [Portunus trituberculatus]|uniref:Uncharacterized protein n=1 Tax=Portunus trituberculatus TaxID=210409 RepID=A0A5B7CQI0_PORTR|nr:hypothetical protein [Portunus trituberculatus]